MLSELQPEALRECFLSVSKPFQNAFQTIFSHEFHGFTRILPLKRQTFVPFVSFVVNPSYLIFE